MTKINTLQDLIKWMESEKEISKDVYLNKTGKDECLAQFYLGSCSSLDLCVMQAKKIKEPEIIYLKHTSMPELRANGWDEKTSFPPSWRGELLFIQTDESGKPDYDKATIYTVGELKKLTLIKIL